jgi:hypothetical protein
MLSGTSAKLDERRRASSAGRAVERTASTGAIGRQYSRLALSPGAANAQEANLSIKIVKLPYRRTRQLIHAERI